MPRVPSTRTASIQTSPADQTRAGWWPLGVALALLAVVAVQIAFAVVAVDDADPVDPTYASEAR